MLSNLKNIWFVLLLMFLMACSMNQVPESQTENITLVSSKAMTTSQRKTYIQQEIDLFNSFHQDQTVKNYKYSQMKTNSFAFLRGTAHLYYKDLTNGTIAIPSQWKTIPNISTWIQGDLHLQNLGFFENKSAGIVFDLNDFDESYVAPFYWDLIRMATSVYLVKNQVSFNFSSSEQDTLVLYFLEEYQKALESASNLEFTESNLSGFMKTQAGKIKGERTQLTLLNKWTVIKNGVRGFDFNNPDLAPLSTQDEAELASWNTYLTDNSQTVTQLGATYFKVKSRAKRLYSGLGSLGVVKYYVLLEGASTSQDNDILVEVKEQRQPSLFLSGLLSSALYQSNFSNHGQKTKTAAKALLKNAENLLGVMKSSTKSYFVKKISPYKFGFEPVDFKSKSDLQNYLLYAAKALAYGHNRSDNAYSSLYVNYDIKTNAVNAIKAWPNAKTTMRTLAKSYARQVETDYLSFQ